MKKILYTAMVFALLIGNTSCSEDQLDPTVAQEKDFNLSINTEEDLEGILAGAYNRLSIETYYGRDYIVFNEVRSDNAFSNANSNRFVTAGQLEILPSDAYPTDTWSRIYSVIGSANIIINAENIEGDAAFINQMKGEALVLRAMAHFDLVRLFGQQHVTGGTSPGGVPYVTTFRDEENFFPARNTVEEVKNLALADIDAALAMMSTSLDGSKEFITTSAANAIKARIALYFGDMTTAATAAKSVIDSEKFSVASETEFASTFSEDNAVNSIFEIAMSPTDNRGINGLANIFLDTSYGDVVVLDNFLTIFDDDDIRIGEDFIEVDGKGFTRNIGKYPSSTFDDNISIIRYEEVILTYAEAMLTVDPAVSLQYLNMIPAQRNASLYTEATLDNILLERRKELAFEGARFHDLVRIGQGIPLLDPLQQTHKGVPYGSFNLAFPIPNSEADVNSNVSQNKGF
ncbi:RagB/SusD domain-containing protein [Cellulophaga sp. RHA19]|uniref:RagB/SusD family nutrient uptake outer membrane protein n=1 Tax=Cellulophaga sp. RHA19 TaxID=1798237 RepID=UPI000C2C0C9C|nr:RagB/SusD family nutrient uptake outer membrane protein [Cellulophaga sp. RHA19]PKB43303.1 RagB/SusD domain-containing protein [Cellulophaga sp. RHA19]